MLQRILSAVRVVGRQEPTLLKHLAPSLLAGNTWRASAGSFSSEALRPVAESELQVSERAAERIREISAEAGKEQVCCVECNCES